MITNINADSSSATYNRNTCMSYN